MSTPSLGLRDVPLQVDVANKGTPLPSSALSKHQERGSTLLISLQLPAEGAKFLVSEARGSLFPSCPAHKTQEHPLHSLQLFLQEANQEDQKLLTPQYQE